jgi:hypothetical protein
VSLGNSRSSLNISTIVRLQLSMNQPQSLADAQLFDLTDAADVFVCAVAGWQVEWEGQGGG